jgi:hypothetical protein
MVTTCGKEPNSAVASDNRRRAIRWQSEHENDANHCAASHRQIPSTVVANDPVIRLEVRNPIHNPATEHGNRRARQKRVKHQSDVECVASVLHMQLPLGWPRIFGPSSEGEGLRGTENCQHGLPAERVAVEFEARASVPKADDQQ